MLESTIDEYIVGAKWRNANNLGHPTEFILVLYREQPGESDLTFLLDLPSLETIKPARRFWRKQGYRTARVIDLQRV